MAYEEIKNKVALITGGSEGIGLGIAKAFVNQGANVVITGRDSSKLNKANEYLGDNAKTFVADVSEVNLCTNTLEEVIGSFGKLDILVNNAATAAAKPVSETTIDEFDSIFNTNVRGLFALTQAAIPLLKKNNGQIINITSVLGMRPMPNYSVYSASKAAVIMLTQLWAKELAPDIRVNSISPGGVETPLYSKAFGEEKSQQVLQFITEHHLLKKLGKPDEIGRAALLLATEDWTTGTNFVIDGGLYYLI